MQSEPNRKLIVDEEFRRLEQPPVEYLAPSTGTGVSGDTPPVIRLWDNIIIEGFSQYESYLQTGMPISTKQVSVRDRREALAWACGEQLKRNDLSNEMRIYLIGKRYSVEKLARGQYPRQSPSIQSTAVHAADSGCVAGKTAVWLGKEYHLGRGTIARYSRYADVIDRLAAIAPNLVTAILSGQLGLTQRAAIRLIELPEQELKRADMDPRKYFARNPRQKERRGRPPICSPVSRAQLSAAMLVKQMPDYDPDADISGLTLTIPSWISSMERTGATAALNMISQTAKDGLSVQLSRLVQSAEKLLHTIGGDM